MVGMAAMLRKEMRSLQQEVMVVMEEMLMEEVRVKKVIQLQVGPWGLMEKKELME
jgi:hypothetical protein